MAGYPDAARLVDAVEIFLRSLEGKLDGRDAFHAKVAGNVLAIVAREMRADPPTLPAHLIARIHAGEITPATPKAVDELLAAAAAQLAIDNPRYSTLTRLGGCTPAPPA